MPGPAGDPWRDDVPVLDPVYEELVDRGWDPGDDGDPETDPDDFEAWLAGLPAEVREDFLAGPFTGEGGPVPAGFLHHERTGPSGVGFASGGVLDTAEPDRWLAAGAGPRHRRRVRRAGGVGADRRAVRLAADGVVGRGRGGRRGGDPRPPPRRRSRPRRAARGWPST